MKASEFRIGNYVDLYGNVAQIQRADFSETEHGIAIDSGRPIPIAEEQLLKLGFEKKSDLIFKLGCFYLADISDYEIEFQLGYKPEKSKVNDPVIYMPIYFKYIHTLQNFFALTGKELTL